MNFTRRIFVSFLLVCLGVTFSTGFEIENATTLQQSTIYNASQTGLKTESNFNISASDMKAVFDGTVSLVKKISSMDSAELGSWAIFIVSVLILLTVAFSIIYIIRARKLRDEQRQQLLQNPIYSSEYLDDESVVANNDKFQL